MTSEASKLVHETDEVLLERLAELSKERPVWLQLGQLIDGVSDAPLRNAHLVFDARQIRFVGSAEDRPPAELLAEGQAEPDGVLRNATALPCLIEAHAHLFLDGAPIDLQQRKEYLQATPEWMLDRAAARWPKILQSGVATVRDAGDKHGVGLALARQAKSRQGQLASTPWIDSPGAAIHHRGRYGSFMGQPIEEHANAADCVADRVAHGADRIKLLVSGIINFEKGRVTAPPQMDTEEVSALVAAAKEHGRQTFAHASGTDGVENAIAGGITTIEHGFFVTREQLQRMRDKQIAWIPTFAPVQLQIDRAAEMGWSEQVIGHLRRIIEEHRKMLALADQLGTPIVAGSDAGSCGVPHGQGLLVELCHTQDAGLPAMAVVRSATGSSANLLQFAEPVGQLAAGFRSRLIITRHDPLASVANLQLDKTILMDGSVVRSDGPVDSEGL